MTNLAMRIKATFSCEVIHASMPRKLGDTWACGRVFSHAFSVGVRCRYCTVQTLKSCTSRPDVQCLVMQTHRDNMSTHKPNTSMTYVACDSKLRSVVRFSMHPSMPRKLGANRACSRDLYPGCPRIRCRS